MLIDCRTADTIQILAPAKINLFLEVLARRPDGFHDIETLLCPIAMFDELTFEFTSTPEIELEVRLPSGISSGEADPAWQIPADDRNLVWRAAREVQRRLKAGRGVRIHLDKRIPAAAGLGGGSSDAAATIVACLIGWSRWDRQLAQEISAGLGSDVPFFLGDPGQIGLAWASGRGELCRPIAARPPLPIVLTHPPVGCSTAAVYRLCQPAATPRSPQEILSACESGQPQKIGAALFNALQSAASQTTDWINRQLAIFSDCGVEHSLMSGSGSSCFAFVSRAQQSECIKNLAAQAGLARVFSTEAWYGDSIEKQIEKQIEQQISMQGG